MQNKLFEMEYYDTYYYASVVHRIVENPWPYLRGLDAFWGDDNYLRFLDSFPKFSVLHQLCAFCIDQIFSEGVDDVTFDAAVHYPDEDCWFNEALNVYGIEHLSFQEWLAERGVALKDSEQDHFDEYYLDLYLEGPIQDLIERVVDEVFFLLFINREFLRRFNCLIAKHVSGLAATDLPQLRKDGILKRKRNPVWVRRAVFYRDRGACGVCNRDISGLLNVHSQKHFDHIVPLAQGGINDVSNIQLLCASCNLKKKDRSTLTSKRYERWY